MLAVLLEGLLDQIFDQIELQIKLDFTRSDDIMKNYIRYIRSCCGICCLAFSYATSHRRDSLQCFIPDSDIPDEASQRVPTGIELESESMNEAR